MKSASMLHTHSHRRIKTDLPSLGPIPLLTPSHSPFARRDNADNLGAWVEEMKDNHGLSGSRMRREPKYMGALIYNKWYIRPSIRMKRSLAKEFNSEDKGNLMLTPDAEFEYNKLYE
jgi:hypothetical protein